MSTELFDVVGRTGLEQIAGGGLSSWWNNQTCSQKHVTLHETNNWTKRAGGAAMAVGALLAMRERRAGPWMFGAGGTALGVSYATEGLPDVWAEKHGCPSK
jgi:hypothetical protein